MININMTSVSVPKNTYMLWLKENRDNIKQMYFANYTPTIDINGKKINFQSLLLKKAGEIWRSIDIDIKETYNIKLQKLKEVYVCKDMDIKEVDNEEDAVMPKSKPKKKKSPKKKNFKAKEPEPEPEEESDDEDLDVEEVVIEGKIYFKTEDGTLYDQVTHERVGEDGELFGEANNESKVTKKLYCPNKCGAYRKTLDGMYSHLGLKENAVDNCTKKQHISNKESYKKALSKLYNGTNETIDFSQFVTNTNESPPPYDVKTNVQPKRKSIPKAVKTSVWNKYIQTDDPKKLSGKCFVGCGCDITIADFELGHVIAHSKGGPNTIKNLRPICSTCNKSMGTMNLLEFKETYGLDSKIETELSEEELKNKIQALDSKISTVTNENDTLGKKLINEHYELEKCNLEKTKINSSIISDESKIQTTKCDINEQINTLKLQIEILQTSLKESISIISKSITDHKIKLKYQNKQSTDYNDNIRAVKEKIDLNTIYLQNINTEKNNYEEKIAAINKKKEAEHNIMIAKLEQEVKEEIKQEQLRKQIKERLIQEQLTKQGELIDLIN